MAARRKFFFVAWWIASGLAPALVAQQSPLAPARPTAARILLLPRRIVSGERATLAVLDVNGRLAPGVTIRFSNGDHLSTDATGRALFVAPLNPGVIFGSIEGRPGRVSSMILTPTEASAPSMETELEPGPAKLTVSCAKRDAPEFSVVFVELELAADASPLRRGEHRTLTVRVHGTSEKISLEARNLAPDVAELEGGNPLRRLSSGGDQENVAPFEVVGKKNGTFLISIRLVSALGRPEGH